MVLYLRDYLKYPYISNKLKTEQHYKSRATDITDTARTCDVTQHNASLAVGSGECYCRNDNKRAGCQLEVHCVSRTLTTLWSPRKLWAVQMSSEQQHYWCFHKTFVN